MTETAVVPAEQKLDLALLKAIGFDRLAPEQRTLALNIAERYQLDPLLKHLVLIDGRVYITRDGLLHVAHRSGQLDGIETTEPVIVDNFWRSTCSVFRKDMGHPFRYTGRYPTSGGNQKFAPEMAVKVGEVMALRRAFDVAAPVIEERWDLEAPAADVAPQPRPTLAERAAAKAAAVGAVERVEAVVLDPEPVEPPAAVVAPPAASEGLTVDAFRDLCAKGGKSTVAIGKAIGVLPDQVGARVKAMTDVERGVLADELGIEWRK